MNKNNKLSSYTLAELETEIARRRPLLERRHKQWSVLTREVIDGLCPEHDFASCSDDDRYIAQSACKVCTRCALLNSLDGGDDGIRDEFDIHVEVRRAQ
jgi:hypothetical protein